MAPDSKEASGSIHGRDAISEDVHGPLAQLEPPTIEAISDALQKYYRALIEEPLPARLLVLLAELEARERGGA